jgi:broad specificity phosphatase PhoE
MVPQRTSHRHIRHTINRKWPEARTCNRKSPRRLRPPYCPQQPRTHVTTSPSTSKSHHTKLHSYVSPRTRAQKTLELLDLGCRDRYPWSESGPSSLDPRTNAHIQVTESIREWDYGNYEGLTSSQVRQSRKERGLNENWDIWRDGCEGGESPEDVTHRLDELIADLRNRFHKDKFSKTGVRGEPNDVLIVAHGHILRAFAARWVGKRLEDNPSLILEAGGVGTLSYEHHSIEEPAILLGGAFVVDVLEKEEEEGK